MSHSELVQEVNSLYITLIRRYVLEKGDVLTTNVCLMNSTPSETVGREIPARRA